MTKQEDQKTAYWRKRMLDTMRSLIRTATPELDSIVMNSNHIRLKLDKIIPLVNTISKALRQLPEEIMKAEVEPLPTEKGGEK